MNFKTLFSSTLLPISIFTLLLSGCGNDVKNAENSIKSPDIESITYLALGDSYTIGTGINSEQSWPLQLRDSLESRNIIVDKTEIIAENGWTTNDLKNGISKAQPDSSFELVSLLIGVNNQYQGLDIQFYKAEFRELLEMAIAFAGSDTDKVFVVSIPNYGVTPFAESRNPGKIREQIEKYNNIAEGITSEYNIPFINVTPISELAAADTTMLANDELHPSPKMYSLWIEKMLPNVSNILQP